MDIKDLLGRLALGFTMPLASKYRVGAAKIQEQKKKAEEEKSAQEALRKFIFELKLRSMAELSKKRATEGVEPAPGDIFGLTPIPKKEPDWSDLLGEFTKYKGLFQPGEEFTIPGKFRGLGLPTEKVFPTIGREARKTYKVPGMTPEEEVAFAAEKAGAVAKARLPYTKEKEPETGRMTPEQCRSEGRRRADDDARQKQVKDYQKLLSAEGMGDLSAMVKTYSETGRLPEIEKVIRPAIDPKYKGKRRAYHTAIIYAENGWWDPLSIIIRKTDFTTEEINAIQAARQRYVGGR